MNRDRLIALYDYVPTEVTSPLALGALRASDSTTTWFEDTAAALEKNERVILSGATETTLNGVRQFTTEVQKLYVTKPDARIALLLHSSQALKIAQGNAFSPLGIFECVYVAFDHALPPTEVRTILKLPRVRWVILPSIGTAWDQWIPQALLPEKRGIVHILAPPNSSDYLNPDELRILLDEFSVQHPLIQFRAVPSEWFVPSQISPWRMTSRDQARTQAIFQKRDSTSFQISVVIPFRWTGFDGDLNQLRQALSGIAALSTNDYRAEIVVAVDRSNSTSSLNFDDLRFEFPDLVIVENVRDDFEDWRAGFIRNCGYEFTDSSSAQLLFLDADVVVRDTESLRNALQKPADLWQTLSSEQRPGFTTASSSLMAIRRKIFENVGGFADAFNAYGCEDQHLVWKAEQIGAEIVALPRKIFDHIRPVQSQDETPAKMQRLKTSAQLFYRMTLSPEVHAHFYSCLGRHVWLRAVLRRVMSVVVLRPLIGLLVFFGTLIESQRRPDYLHGLYDVAAWKAKRPLFWLRSNTWRIKPSSHWWRLGVTTGRLKGASWRIGVTIDRLKGSSWRITSFITSRTQRIFGAIRRFSGWILGFTYGPREKLQGETRRFAAWVWSKIGLVKKELWGFREPTEWFRLRIPLFYQWVWRPILKIRYFLGYHLIQRWRDS